MRRAITIYWRRLINDQPTSNRCILACYAWPIFNYGGFMSMKALADDLNEAVRLFNQGKIEDYHMMDLIKFHNACARRKENE